MVLGNHRTGLFDQMVRDGKRKRCAESFLCLD
ncbi:hypothetical protein [Roseiconus lacunae]